MVTGTVGAGAAKTLSACYDPAVSVNIEFVITIRGNKRTAAASKVRNLLDDYGFLDDFETTDEDSDPAADEIVFESGGGIIISRSYEVLPRFEQQLAKIATGGVQLELKTRNDVEEDPEWQVTTFGR